MLGRIRNIPEERVLEDFSLFESINFLEDLLTLIDIPSTNSIHNEVMKSYEV